jgi:hypothetical protein
MPDETGAAEKRPFFFVAPLGRFDAPDGMRNRERLSPIVEFGPPGLAVDGIPIKRRRPFILFSGVDGQFAGQR